MKERILFVDDDSHILRAYQRRFRGQYDLECASGPHEALALFDQGAAFAVIISDLRMPGMDGIQLLEQVHRRSPDTVQIILTGNALLETSTESAEGHIFLILEKPCPGDTLAGAIEAALSQYRLIAAEQEVLSRTSDGTVHVPLEARAHSSQPEAKP